MQAQESFAETTDLAPTSNVISPPANDAGHFKTGDRFIDHYFRRIDPELAASFTQDQRRAIKAMFGTRGVTRHPVDIRRSLPLGRNRFYMVFLAGRERRTLRVLRDEGVATWTCDFLSYLGLALVMLMPFLVGAYLYRTLFAGA